MARKDTIKQAKARRDQIRRFTAPLDITTDEEEIKTIEKNLDKLKNTKI